MAGQVVAGDAPAERRGDAPAERRGSALTAPWRFINESIAELKKVEWPGQNQVVQGTVVVLIACLIVGVYLWLNDQVWSRFVSHVLLR